MATITATNGKAVGAVTITETTLTASDTFTYKSGINQTLILRNDTAGALTPVIDGDGASTVSIAGAGSFDISGGYSVGSIGVGVAVTIKTDTIASYLRGTIAITGGTGLTAQLIEY